MHMEKHREFTDWAISKGVRINGIAAHFQGRGVGVIAEKKHEAGEVLLYVPSSALRTVYTAPKDISRKLQQITVHGLLAADLSFDHSPVRAPWRAVLPTKADLLETMPYMWEPALQNLLPPAAKALLENQERKFQKDWSAISKSFPQLTEEIYLYHWLIVNTRTFYWIASGTNKSPLPDDCMALNPFADYFNHADEGCVVKFGPNGFGITSNRAYEKGEEIFISYGNHSNDFLLVEYGFILSENKWDEILLDEIIFPELSIKQRDHLKEVGFLGKYILDRMTVCHRTQVALRLLCVPLRTWRCFVNGEDDGERDQAKVDQILLRLLKSYQKRARDVAEQASSLTVGLTIHRQTLSRRWKQIDELLQAVINRIRE